MEHGCIHDRHAMQSYDSVDELYSSRAFMFCIMHTLAGLAAETAIIVKQFRKGQYGLPPWVFSALVLPEFTELPGDV